jgi:hypothetical protein
VPWIIVQVSQLPVSVPNGCSMAARFSVIDGVGGAQTLAQLLETEPCCYSSIDWVPVSDAVVAAVRVVGGLSGAAIDDELRRRITDPNLLRCALEWVDDGMNWQEGLQRVFGGEHRLCALRQQGGKLTVVLTP